MKRSDPRLTLLLEALEEEAEQPASNALFELVAATAPDKVVPKVGQLWTVRSREKRGAGAMVLLTHVADGLRGVLAIKETFVAGHDDLWVDAAISPLGRPLLLCTWVDTPILDE